MRRSFPWVAVPILLAAPWLALLYLAGQTITADSAKYLSSAAAMWLGRSTVQPTWPPLYQALIALGMAVTSFPSSSAALVAAVAVIAALCLTFSTLARLGAPGAVCALITSALALFVPFVRGWTFALSDLPFAVFVLWAVWAVAAHEQNSERRYFLWGCVAVACASLTRYMGFSLLAAWLAYGLYLAIGRRRLSYLGYAVLSTLPILFYLLRNRLVFGSPFAGRVLGTASLFDNLRFTLQTLQADLPWPLLVLLVLAAALFILYPSYRPTALFIAGFAALYMVQLLYSASVYLLDPIPTRYLYPLYPLLFILVGLALTLARTEAVQVTMLALPLVFAADQVSTLGHELTAIAQPSQLSHLNAGFGLSSTASGLRSILFDALRDTDELTVTVAFDYSLTYSKRVRPTISRALFLRSDWLDGAQGVKFHPLGSDDFEITFTLDGRSKRLIYRNLPILTDNHQLVDNLSALPKPLIFFARNEKTIDLSVPAALAGFPLGQVDFYTVYLIK